MLENQVINEINKEAIHDISNDETLKELVEQEITPYYNKNLIENNEYVYLDYTEDKQFALRAKQDIPINIKILKEDPIIFMPLQLQYDQDPFVKIIFTTKLLVKLAKQYSLDDSLYFFNFTARVVSLIGIADDIFQSILNLSDGNLSKNIILCKKSERTLKNIELVIKECMKENFKSKISEKDLFRIICIFWSNTFHCSNPEGYALYLSITRINHSCYPNLFEIYYKKKFTICSFRNINKNEEIFLSYINNDALYKKRQHQLKDFNFICGCEKCCQKNDKSMRIARCEQCKDGKMRMNDQNLFICQQCGKQEDQEFTTKFEQAEKELSVNGFKNWNKDSILHPVHFKVQNYWSSDGIYVSLENKQFEQIDQFLEIFTEIYGKYSPQLLEEYKLILNKIKKDISLKQQSDVYQQKSDEIQKFCYEEN